MRIVVLCVAGTLLGACGSTKLSIPDATFAPNGDDIAVSAKREVTFWSKGEVRFFGPSRDSGVYFYCDESKDCDDSSATEPACKGLPNTDADKKFAWRRCTAGWARIAYAPPNPDQDPGDPTHKNCDAVFAEAFVCVGECDDSSSSDYHRVRFTRPSDECKP